MKFGLCLPNFPFGVHPSRDVIIEVAQEAERLGYNSIWATDHIVAPKDKPRFGYLYESLSTLAYLRGATKNISLGTSILVLPYRNAITVAKQIHPNGIPIWVGGNSDAALRRAAQYGDAWHADDLLPDQLATSSSS